MSLVSSIRLCQTCEHPPIGGTFQAGDARNDGPRNTVQVKHKWCFRNKATYLWIRPPTLLRRCSFNRKVVVEGEEHVVEQHRRERALRDRVE